MNKKHLFLSILLSLFFCVLFTNCATLMSYPGQRFDTLEIGSDPENAIFKIYDKKDKIIAEGVTPSNVVIKGSAPFRVEILLEDYETQTFGVKKGINGYYWANVPLIVMGGGLIGLVLDPINHKVVKIMPNDIYARLQLSQEGIIARHERMLQEKGLTEEEWQRQEAEQRRREEIARQEQNALSQLIQNLIDVGFNVGKPFRMGDIVSIPYGLFAAIDYSRNGDVNSYLVIMNDYSTPSKPFYIETTRQLNSVGSMRIEYIGTAQYLENRVPRSTLRFKEVR
jgi:hypothetical protein